MRLAVDKWGRVEVTDPADFTVKEDNNFSLIEYVLVQLESFSLVKPCFALPTKQFSGLTPLRFSKFGFREFTKYYLNIGGGVNPLS
ncbi:Uncharacterized protein MA16_Dca002629 [Dendrobium catenatum]|uniref:Uncharacterized protein n=1 Tax=Dendrobium catenatum TaxID=906689 RepID=A0A2I0W121_9ASPA|nr:Uncharacterized protein MA16_Dca002629 [Dendrobium catenatum]